MLNSVPFTIRLTTETLVDLLPTGGTRPGLDDFSVLDLAAQAPPGREATPRRDLLRHTRHCGAGEQGAGGRHSPATARPCLCCDSFTSCWGPSSPSRGPRVSHGFLPGVLARRLPLRRRLPV
jgi:hypothetical protein